MKKLFLTIVMLCVAMVGWSQDKLSKDFTDGVLTITYTGGGVTEQELRDLVGGPADGIAHHATKIVFDGPFTNADISGPIDKLIGHVAAPNQTFEVDLSGCSEALCVYNGKSANNETLYLPKDNNAAYSSTEYDVTPTTANFYKCYNVNGANFTLSGLPQELVPGTTYTGVSASDGAYNNLSNLSVWHNGNNWVVNLWGQQNVVIESGQAYTYTDNAGVSHVVAADDPNLNADKTKYTEVTSLGSDEFKLGDNFKNKVSKLTFPASANFKMVPNDLCYQYNKLQEIVLPNQIEVIGNKAFKECSVDSVNWSTGLILTGGESFHGAAIRTANLSACSALQEIDYESFEECAALTSVTFPSGSTFTLLGNDAFRKSGLKKVDMSMCDGITEFVFANSAYRQFSECLSLTEAILPPNLTIMPSSDGNQVFAGSANLGTVTFTGVAKYENGRFVNPLIIDKGAFSELKKLTVVNFSNNLKEIRENAFKECAIEYVYLEGCHELIEIQKDGFVDCTAMKEVHLCSHPKTIRTEAFHNIKTITRVEVHGCENTCMTEVICENRGFELDITHHQTAALNAIEDCALLVFPEDGEVCANSPYTSAWDFFVGDYKKGTLITQENLLCYYRLVPNDGQGDTKKYENVYDEDGNLVYENGEPKLRLIQPFHVECMYQKGNGWHEFINVGFGEVVPKGEFLRTYSRSHGDGPCQLPSEITAYRAVDYKSTKTAYVLDKVGTHYFDPELTDDAATEIDERYVAIPVVDGEFDQDVLAEIQERGLKRYSYLTVGGILYLRPLWAKIARYPAGGQAQYEGYEGDNIDIFNSEEIYSQLQNVPGKHSYVPENTGVVLYSTNITEDAFLMLPGDFGTATVYKEFPHTGDRYEEGRRNGGEDVNTDDDINMLQGSYDTGWTVAPVYPWLYNGQKVENNGDAPEEGVKYTKGHYSYKNSKAYRNFACTVINTASDGKKTYGWQRLQPSVLKVNRAFAQIHVNRFDNFNEGVDQMPDFTIEDMPTETPSNSLMLIGMFEGEDNVVAADGIKSVNTVETKVYDNAWYTIQGVRVSKPQMGGVYIHNGQKVVIK